MILIFSVFFISWPFCIRWAANVEQKGHEMRNIEEVMAIVHTENTYVKSKHARRLHRDL